MVRNAFACGLMVAVFAVAGCAEEDDASGTPGTADGGTLDAGRPDAALGDATTGDAAVAAEAGACGTLTYANFGKQLFDTNCTVCHSAKPIGDGNTRSFHTVELIRAGKQDIIDHTVEPRQEPKMPQGGALSALDQDKLKSWLNCGAP